MGHKNTKSKKKSAAKRKAIKITVRGDGRAPSPRERFEQARKLVEVATQGADKFGYTLPAGA